jgi:hypothetical protein
MCVARVVRDWLSPTLCLAMCLAYSTCACHPTLKSTPQQMGLQAPPAPQPLLTRPALPPLRPTHPPPCPHPPTMCVARVMRDWLSPTLCLAMCLAYSTGLLRGPRMDSATLCASVSCRGSGDTGSGYIDIESFCCCCCCCCWCCRC